KTPGTVIDFRSTRGTGAFALLATFGRGMPTTLSGMLLTWWSGTGVWAPPLLPAAFPAASSIASPAVATRRMTVPSSSLADATTRTTPTPGSAFGATLSTSDPPDGGGFAGPVGRPFRGGLGNVMVLGSTVTPSGSPSITTWTFPGRPSGVIRKLSGVAEPGLRLKQPVAPGPPTATRRVA